MSQPSSNPLNDGSADDRPPVTRTVAVSVWEGGVRVGGEDAVAEEVPVALVYNGVSHAVMMTSPADLADFALGFSLTEGILERPDELFSLEVRPETDGIEVDMHIDGARFAALREHRRNLTGRTGCGLCGTESLAFAIRPLPRITPGSLPDDNAVQRALAGLRERQPLQQQTGATHGAAWCSLDGEVLAVREDVGRHNALDKLIGALSAEGPSAFDNGFALVSSRASYEMVQKSARAGIRCLVAVSAPTALAIREAEQAGLALIGFGRPGRHVRYTEGQTGSDDSEEALT